MPNTLGNTSPFSAPASLPRRDHRGETNGDRGVTELLLLYARTQLRWNDGLTSALDITTGAGRNAETMSVTTCGTKRMDAAKRRRIRGMQKAIVYTRGSRSDMRNRVLPPRILIFISGWWLPRRGLLCGRRWQGWPIGKNEGVIVAPVAGSSEG